MLVLVIGCKIHDVFAEIFTVNYIYQSVILGKIQYIFDFVIKT
jgi:hypothetical protein